MNSRERLLAAMKFEPVDRLPFWPKISKGYIINQSPEFNTKTQMQMFDYIDCDPLLGVDFIIKTNRTNTDYKRINKETYFKEIYTTPIGECERVSHIDDMTRTSHPTKMPIQNLNDIKIMTQWYKDMDTSLDEQLLANQNKTIKEIGDRGMTTMSIGESPLMYFIEFLAGLENAHYFIADYKDEVNELFYYMHQDLVKRTKIIAQNSKVDCVTFVENTSTSLISPAQYQEYCIPHVSEYCAICNDNSMQIMLHMCGFLKNILTYLKDMPATAFEAFTSSPVGNTSFPIGRKECPNICLIGGTNATLWLKSADEIFSEIKEHLDSMKHHRGLIVTSAGVMPPACKPETIKKVSQMVRNYKFRT